MKQLRLNTIAGFVEKLDRVADIGCDHAYLAIFLKKEKKCTSVIASDIHKNALEMAKKNCQKENVSIPLFLSDGLENLDQEKLNTLIISGMGTNTILHILESVNKKYIQKLILQSNNDLPKLRKKVQKIGYSLTEEKIIYENGHYYVIGKYTKEKRKLNCVEIEYGIYHEENHSYYLYLFNELKGIVKNLPGHFSKKLRLYWKLWLLKRYL